MLNKIKIALKTDTTRDTLIGMVGSGGIAVGGMLFTVLVARSLPPETFGIFSALLALAMLLASLGDLGISSALVNFLPKLQNNRSVIISVTFWIQAISALFLGLLIIGAIPLQKYLVPGSRPIHFVLIAIIASVYILEGFALSILNAEKKFRVTATLQILDSGTKLFILAILFFYHQVSIEAAFLATITSAIIATSIGISRELKNVSFLFPKKHFLEIFHFTKWIGLMRIFSVAVSRIDVIILVSLSGGYQAGIYAAASRIALLFSLIVSTLGNVVAPRFSGFTSHHALLTYMKKLAVLTTGVALLMLSTAIFAPQIISLVFGAKYLAAVPVFQAMSLAMVPFLYTIVTVNPLIYYFNRPDLMAKITIVQVLVLVAIDLLLIPRLGAFAPTIALGVSNSLVLLISGIKLRHLLKA